MYLDVQEQWRVIKANAVKGISSLFPIEGKLNRITVSNIEVKEPGGTLKQQRDALLSGRSITAGISGTVTLETTMGKRLDSKVLKLLDMPFITQRGTFVVKGKDYSVFKQLRLKPGVYSKVIPETGMVSTRFNLGKGLGFKIVLNPVKSIFQVQFDSSMANTGGQVKIPLYSVYKVTGGTEQEFKDTLGDELATINISESNYDSDVKRLHALVVYSKNKTEDLEKDIKQYYKSTQLSADTTSITLGEAFSSVQPRALLLAAKKMTEIFQGEKDEDDMDSLLFKELLNVEDHILLKITKGAAQPNGVLSKIRRRVDIATEVKECVPNNFLSPLIETFFTSSSMSSPQAEINPLEILETHSKVTAMGEGGIKSDHGIPYSARNLHPSHFGFIDPVRTTESTRVGVDSRMTQGSSIKNREIYTAFIDKSGKKVQLRPADLIDKTIAFPNQGPLKELKVMFNEEVRTVPRSMVDYHLPDSENMFTHTSNLTPFLHNNQGNRVTMSSRMMTQAVPLTDREAPLVQVSSSADSKKSLEKELGEKVFTAVSPLAGLVQKVEKDFIQISGQKVDLYNSFPLNQKTFIHMTPVVKVGDRVTKGQLLAESNFTQGGTLALGTNLRVGYMTAKGYNHEDGIVISETAAQKLTSEHMYTEVLDLTPDIITSKKDFVTLFPTKTQMVDLGDIDESGTIKEGSIVKRGGYLILAMQKKDFTNNDLILQKMNKSLANPYKDISVKWEHDREGVVVNVVKMGKKITVVLSTKDEMRVGDKLCYSSDTEVLTDSGWTPFPELTMSHKICCLDPESDSIVYSEPSKVYSWDHNEDMYYVKNQSIDLLVTQDHQMYVKGRGEETYSLRKARDIKGKRVSYKKNGIWDAPRVESFTLPSISHKHNKGEDLTLPMDLWLEFLGYYLSEGNTDNSCGNYSVVLHQSETIHPAIHSRMYEVLTSLGFKAHKGANRWVVHNKQLYSYMAQFKLCDSKFIPQELLALGREQLTILFDALMAGDGYVGPTSSVYSTTSKLLADQVQEVALKCGIAADVSLEYPKNKDWLPLFRVRLKRTRLCPTVNHGHVGAQIVQEEGLVPYSGKVYCCTVPTHVLYVRRNGKAVWSGNTGRHGNKGTITMILPDKEMPKTKDDRHIEMLLNPASVVSRVNTGQLYESMAGKLAEKMGKPYIIKNFNGEDSSKKVLKDLKDQGLSPEEEVIDAESGKSLGKVFVGNQYTLKLHKQTEGNFSARTTGRYDANLQPAKGGEEGAKAIGMLDMYALLGHNNRAFLSEVVNYKAQKNEEFWDSIRLGTPLPQMKEPFVFDKFKALLTASGVNVRQDDASISFSPLTDKHIKSKSNGVIRNSGLLKGSVSNAKEEKGGLFDPSTTGGMKGTQWAHIDLAEKIPNPIFIKQIQSLIKKDPTELSGTELHAELKNINVKARTKELEDLLKANKSAGSSRDKILKEYRYLMGLTKEGMKPTDYMLSTAPILPPVFRPIFTSPSGQPLIADMNMLYKDMINVNEELKKIKDYPDDQKAGLRKALFGSVSAAMGMTEPINEKSRKSGLKGSLKQLVGDTAKDGFVHRKLLYKPQDSVGRGTILPDPTLHVDEIKIPKDMAYKLFQPFAIRTLVSSGMKPVDALKEVKNRTLVVEKIIEKEMTERPVLINRAPTLHKYNIMAFKAKMTDGKSIFIPPLTIGGFNADFDGDSVSGDTFVWVEIVGVAKLMRIKDV